MQIFNGTHRLAGTAPLNLFITNTYPARAQDGQAADADSCSALMEAQESVANKFIASAASESADEPAQSLQSVDVLPSSDSAPAEQQAPEIEPRMGGLPQQSVADAKLCTPAENIDAGQAQGTNAKAQLCHESVVAAQPSHHARLQLSTQPIKATGIKQYSSLYLVKKSPTAVEQEHIDSQVEIGILSGQDALTTVSKLLEQVYIPMLAASMPEQDALVSTGTMAASNNTSSDADLMAALQKFLHHVNMSAAHLNSNVQLALPERAVDPAAAKDPALLALLEGIMKGWTDQLQEVKQAETNKQAAMNGPLDEVQYWAERSNVLGGMHEQLAAPPALAVIKYAPKLKFLHACTMCRR